MRTAYIVDSSANIVAKTETELKDGTSIRFAYDACDEHINRNREQNLVNARWGEIQSGAKWQNEAEKLELGYGLDWADEINPEEFLVSTY